MMRAQVGHQVTPLLNNSSSRFPLLLNPPQKPTTAKWQRSATSPNALLAAAVLCGSEFKRSPNSGVGPSARHNLIRAASASSQH